MITLPNVPAYSFPKKQKKSKVSLTPGPGDYNWQNSKQRLLKKSAGVVFARSKKSSFDFLSQQRDRLLTE